MDTVEVICIALGWTVQDLSHEARIAWVTANNAYKGIEPAARTKRDICSAFSKAMGKTIQPGEIEWRKEN